MEVRCLQGISRLYGWVYNSLRVSVLIDEHRVMVVTTRFDSAGSQLDSYRDSNYKRNFIKFVFRSSGA